MGGLTERQFVARLTQKLKLNNIRDFNLKEMIKVERGNGAVKVHLQYEMREHLFSNIDIVMSFDENYEKVTI